MKKILLKLWVFITSRLLQFVLAYIAFMSWEVANDLGYTVSNSGSSAVAITSGYDGGALAMGLITCGCIIGIVWLEAIKIRKPK